VSISCRIARRRIGLLASALLALVCTAFAQPLERGIEGNGSRFLLDNGTIRQLGQDFQTARIFKDEAVKSLYQGQQGWQGSFLALSDKGLSRFSTSGDFKPRSLLAAEAVQVVPWGENFLAYVEQGKELLLATAEKEARLPLAGELASVDVVDHDLALIRAGGGLFSLRLSSPETDGPTLSRLGELPWSAAEARLEVASGRAVLWTPTSDRIVVLGGHGPASTPQGSGQAGSTASVGALELPAPPSAGVRVMADGSVVCAGERILMLVSPEGEVRQFPAPRDCTEANFAEWQVIKADRELQVFSDRKGRLQVLHFRMAGSTPNDLLAEGEFHAVILPQPGSGGSPLLFVDTRREEAMVDENGRIVYDLEKQNVQQKRTVHGYRIYQLSSNGNWRPIAEDSRTALAGPIERVGDRAIYATRTEPEHYEGKKISLDRSYPYPAVILHGRSLRNPADVWSYDKPRGQTPSKDRLPENEWPLAGEQGPLLITSEGTTLLAIDPATGERTWESARLPMNEAAPPMVQWSDAFALIAAEGTGRTLLAFDLRNGAVLREVSLSPIFFWEKWRHLLGLIVVCLALAYYIYQAGKRDLYIRQIAGLKALDEAVGRATEMGKPVLYVVGLADVDDIQTLASLSILSHVARTTAEYDTPIVATTSRAVTFAAAQEIVRDAFSVAGHPDAFSVDSVRYISDDQFGYTAGVDGIMMRERPAANFYIGNFYAESLILAETGYATGSIQIAGTAQASQIPFFVAACDYTLIGEELYAASAYLSRDPLQVGSLRGQDVGKMIVMVLLVVCSILVSFHVDLQTVAGWMEVTLP
jgi:hypothetical protein